MDTRFLESFVTVIDCGSMAEAARRLNLTPAAIAQRIRALESDFGAPLLLRSGRSVQPTEAGGAIIERARKLLSDAREMKAIASSDKLSGELVIGVIQTTLPGLFAEILIPFTKAYPAVDVRLVRDHSAGLYRRIMDGGVDVAVTSEPPFAIPKTCEWHALREEPFVVLTPSSMPARDAHAVLAKEPFIRLDRNVYAGQLIDQYLRKAGIRPHERYELDGLELIVVMVDRGLGVSLLPDWHPPWPEGLSLRKLPLPDRTFCRRTGLLWNRASSRGRLIRALLKQARAALGGKRSKLSTRTTKSK
jgi:DNA-binding transcriptional LysR family regulator